MKKWQMNTLFIMVLVILSFNLFFWLAQKEGFHEDEIFSYGSSNNKYDGVYQRYGDKDEVTQVLFDDILVGDFNEIYNKIIYYLKNPSKFMEKYNKILDEEQPIWKNNNQAKEYLTIQKDNVFNYFGVFFNQTKDIHPPLFYLLVHIFSSIFLGLFSKYIIFFINLIFFILTCIIIRKILKIYNKEYLSIPAIILYGGSIGGISIVLFLRMYQMLIFFSMLSLYIHLKIINNDFEIDKKIRNELIIVSVLGFLTQYYFCIFQLFEFIVLIIMLIKNKKYNTLKRYIKYTIISAIIGILIFPSSIYHIFFSYRGTKADITSNFIERIKLYFNELSYAFSLVPIILVILFLIILAIEIKQRDVKNIILILPTILYFLVICKIAPEMKANTIIRYIAIILPICSLIMVLEIDKIFKIENKNIVLIFITVPILLLALYSNFNSEPRFLYRGYNNIIEIAKENEGNKLIYICENNYTYIGSIQEFLIYKEHIIINTSVDSLEMLKDDEKIKNQEAVIVNIRKYMNYEEILKKIMEMLKFDKYSILEDSDEFETVIYKLYR